MRESTGNLRGQARGAAAFVLLTAYLAGCVLWWAERQWRPEWDSATYLLTGLSLAAEEGYRYLGEPFFLRPPGFAWLLSLFVRDGAYDHATLNRIVMFFAGTSIAAIAFALRQVVPPWTALGVALLAGTSAIYRQAFNWVVADFPFVTGLFLAIGLLELLLRRSRRAWLAAAAAALVLAGSIYLRSVGVLLLPLLVGMSWLRSRRPVRWWAVATTAIVVALVLPWWLHARSVSVLAESPSEQLMLFDYSTAMWHVDTGEPASARVSLAGWVERVSLNGTAFTRDLAEELFYSPDVWARVIASLLVLVGWALACARRPSLLEGFSLLYTLLLLTYFTYDPRLALPLVPLVYLYVLEAAFALTRFTTERTRRPRSGTVVPGLVFVLLLGANVPALRRLDPPRDTGFPELGAWLRENTPADAVILCGEAPIVGYASGRRAYTYSFARSTDLLRKYDVDYVVLNPSTPGHVLRDTAARAVRRWDVAGRRVVQVR